MLETAQLLLRKPRVEDADDLLVDIEDPDVMRWIGPGLTGDRDAAVASVERWLRQWDSNGIGHFSRSARRSRDRPAGIPRLGRVALGGVDVRGGRRGRCDGARMDDRAAVLGPRFATEAARALREWAYAPAVRE